MTKKDKVLLAAIVVSMANAAAPYHMATMAELKGLLKDGMVETNDEIKDGDKVAVRASDKGVEANTANEAAGATAPVTAPELTIGTGFVIPEGASRKKPEMYPFDTLAIGGFIFVPKTDAKPDPAKSLASTVSAATKRYATLIEGQTRTDRNGKVVPATQNTRVFTVVPVKGGVQYGDFIAPSDGAAIVRAVDAVPGTPAATATA